MRLNISLLLTLLLSAQLVLASTPIEPPSPEDTDFIKGVFNRNFCVIYCVVMDIAGVLATLLFVWCGLNWITSQDDPAARQRARDTMAYILLGLLLIYLARPLAETVMGSAFACTLC